LNFFTRMIRTRTGKVVCVPIATWIFTETLISAY
jgi:hypothetical protein